MKKIEKVKHQQYNLFKCARSVILLFIFTFVFFNAVKVVDVNAAECASQNCSYNIGNFTVINNKWGNSSATQSIFVNGNTFGWEWDNPNGGGWNAPEIYAGTTRNCGASTWNVFPLQYKNLSSASTQITWKYTKKPTVGSWWNFAFDIYWMNNTTQCDQRKDKMFNIMIWIHGKPEFAQGNGTLVRDNISDGNNTWSYYEYQHPAPLDWPWRAFVLKNRDQIPYEPVLNQQYSITINIKALMNSITDASLNGDWYVPGIELADENSGSLGSTVGRQEISSFCLEINGNQTCTNDSPIASPTPIPSGSPTPTPNCNICDGVCPSGCTETNDPDCPGACINPNCPTDTDCIFPPPKTTLEKWIKAESIKELIANAYKVSLSIIGALALLMIIIGGMMYMSAAGDDQKVLTAKKVITYAIGGLVLILLAYAISSIIEKVFMGG